MKRTIVFYKSYFLDFYNQQDVATQKKIEFVLDLVRFEQNVPKKFFKHLTNTNGIYEIRVITTFKNIRVLCIMDGNNLVVLMNSFAKKSQKTPLKEIRLAQQLKKEYLNNKNDGK